MSQFFQFFINAWIAQQENAGKKITDEQRRWLEMIRDHIAANLSIDANNFDYAPFAQQGGLGKVYQVFGDECISPRICKVYLVYLW